MSELRDVNILLVEDNPDHAEMIRRALQEADRDGRVYWVKDGEEALDFLKQKGAFAGPNAAPRPGLILLDLKLPKIGGNDVLRLIKADRALRNIPVVMLTTSDREREIAESTRRGASQFVTKPVRFSEFVERVRRIELDWTPDDRPYADPR